FASTRFVQRAEQEGLLATNLFSVFPDGTGLIRLTTDRNGAEEPSVDPRNGRIVYARWWFNRHRPPVVPADTLTTDPDRAMPSDPVDLWHAISIRADGDGMRLAGGWPRVRSQTMAYQPVLLHDGTLVGVTSATGSLLARPGERLEATLLVAYPGGFAPPVPIAAGGVSPLALPDDRIVYSAPGPGGDLALFLVRSPGQAPVVLADTPGFDDLDAVVLMPREAPARLDTYLPPPIREAPVSSRTPLEDPDWTFRFDCLNVFANGPVDSPFPDAPPITEGLRIRFFAAIERPGSAADSIVLVREAPVLDGGAVHEHEMPADTPMFEQLVDARGEVIRGFNGPAHVPGFNFGRFGSGTKCVGCHAGHSAMEVARNNSLAAWTNLAPSARLTTQGVTNPGQGTRTLVDRRAKGPIGQVGCRLRGDGEDRVRLSWPFPVEVKEVILYAGPRDRAHGDDSRIRLTDITFLDADRPVHAGTITRDLDPAGTHLEVDNVRIDALDIHFRRVEGTIDHEPGGALSEIEVIGRLVDR
ncbi:MAG TPA: hypothetical protein VF720_00080, partial [Candidatus Eisenbacteria bacterium]